jgi:anti-sigma factor ChrR (cupin superfamily)
MVGVANVSLTPGQPFIAAARKTLMLVNADFSIPVIVTPAAYEWVASPQQGIERVMLDRIGEEQARATSIVRYAPHSSFPHHQHPEGEEILVLSGVFSADRQHYPAGWYLRNPPGSGHRPSSSEGAVIFVKLRQMSLSETRPVRVDTRDPQCWQVQGEREVCPLFANGMETVGIQRLAPGEPLFAGPTERAELLVISGEVAIGGVRCEPGSWARLPAGHDPMIVACEHGASVYLKIGYSDESAVKA